MAVVSIRFRAVSDSFDPLEEHTHIGGNEYVTESEEKIDLLEESDKIEVLDWGVDDELDRGIQLVGPPEPVIRDDGTPVFVKPNDDGHLIDVIELGTWVCQRCGKTTKIPPVDGELEEPYECDGCERQGPFDHKGVDGSQIRAVEHAQNAWLPPSRVDDSDFPSLWVDIREYIEDHWFANESEIYEGLAAYAITTWLREELTFLPHLMLMGKTTGGKTRLLNTLKRVSYRALVSASATPASMFRLVHHYDTTYYVSEYHGLDYDTRRELDNIVRAGQKRGEIVTRAEKVGDGHEPKVYDPFSHIAIATQFTPDDDIVNRCIQIRSTGAEKDLGATLDEERARELRDRLMYARYRLLDSDEWADAETDAYAHLAAQGIDGRTREKLLSIVTAAVVWDRVDAIAPFIDEIVMQDRKAAADSEDALVVEAIRDLAFDEIGDTAYIGDDDPFADITIPIADIRERFEDMTGEEKSPSWFGHVRSRLDLGKERHRDGTVIKDEELRVKLQKHCADHNLEWEKLEPYADVEELDDEKMSKRQCEQCGADRLLTHRDLETGDKICGECATEIEES